MRSRRRLPRLGLRANFVLVGLLALLPYLGLVGYTTFELRQEAHAAFDDNLQRFVSVFSDINFDVYDASSSFVLAVKRFANADGLSSAEILEDLQQLLTQRRELVAGGLLRPDGTQMSATTVGYAFTRVLASSSFYRDVVASGGIVVGQLLRDPVTGQEYIPVGTTVEANQDKVTDVAFVLVGVGQLRYYWGRLLSGFPLGTRYAIIDRNGTAFSGTMSGDYREKSTTGYALFGVVPQVRKELTTSRPDGVRRFWRFSPAAEVNLLGSHSLIGIGVPTTAVDGPALRVALRNLVGLAITGLVLLTFGLWLLEKRAFSPLRSVMGTIVDLGEGDFSARTNAGPIGGEIGRLVRSIDATAELLQREGEQRRHLFDSLAESEARYRTLMDTSTDGIILVDSGMEIVAANTAFAKMVGVESPVGLDGRSFLAFIDGPYQEILAGDREGGGKGLVPSTATEVRLVSVDGALFPAELSVAMATSFDGLSEQSVVIARDISERQRLEEDKRRLNEQLLHAQKMESVGVLAGGVAHDFNNLLTVIQGYVGLARTDASSGKTVLDHLLEIEKAATRAGDLTRQLLLFSRRTPMNMTMVEMRQLVEGLGKMLRRLIGENVRFGIHAEDSLFFVSGDPGSIEQAIVNLVVNARDAMPTGGQLDIRVAERELSADEVSDRGEAGEGRYVVVEIKDTGHGIPAEVVSGIFEPFFTTKARGKGTGLGLSVASKVLQQHRGWIEVHSVVGEGTTFELYFPEAANNEEAIGTSEVLHEKLEGRGEVVLVVEDDEHIRHFVRQVLSEHGYRVVCAKDKQEVVNIIADESATFDLLVCDYILPDGNGWEVATMARAAHPAVPVLFSSGYIDNQNQMWDIERQGYPFLRKPFTVDELIEAIGKLLKKQPSK